MRRAPRRLVCAPRVGDRLTAFAAFAEALLQPITVVGGDDDVVALPRLGDRDRRKAKSDKESETGGMGGKVTHGSALTV